MAGAGISLSIPSKQFVSIANEAKDRGMSEQDLIRLIIDAYLESKGSK